MVSYSRHSPWKCYYNSGCYLLSTDLCARMLYRLTFLLSQQTFEVAHAGNCFTDDAIEDHRQKNNFFS